MASRHDPAAFRTVYDRWAEPMFSYFYRRTWDPEVAADLTAETFAVAYQKRWRFKDMGRPAGAWLYGIAGRELKRFRRSKRTELRAVHKLGMVMPVAESDAFARVDELVDLGPLRRELEAALALLTAADRNALRLRVLDGEPYSTVAARLGCSEGAARVRVHRALARLGVALEESR